MAFDQGHALLIGVGSNKYEPKLNVPITVADAEALAKVIGDEQFCGYPASQVNLLRHDSATTAGILAALDQLAASAKTGDTVLIFYSGHGDLGSDGQYYLVSHDAKISNRRVVKDSGVSEAALIEKLRQIKAERVVMIFNACHSGSISPTLSIDQAKSDDLGAKSLPNKAADVLLGTGAGRFIITACRENQYSWIGDGELTLFTQALVNGFEGRSTWARGGYISAFDLYTALYEEVKENVEETYGQIQEPELTVIKGIGPFAVALYKGATETNLRAAEAESKIPAEIEVREIKEAKAQKLYQRYTHIQVGDISAEGGSQINIAGGNISTRTVDTGGGDYVEGGMKIEKGDYVAGNKSIQHGDQFSFRDISAASGVAFGRDNIVEVNYGLAEIEQLFVPVIQSIHQAAPLNQPKAFFMVEELQAEAAKGPGKADDSRMAKLMDGLVELVPGAVSAVISAFASPLLAGIAGPVTKFMLEKIQNK